MRYDDLAIRNAYLADLGTLAEIKPPQALHKDRILVASQTLPFLYLVLTRADIVIGFACLVFVRPEGWPDANKAVHLPEIVDLVVAPELRDRGYGSFFIGEMENIAKARGYKAIYLSVDYPANSNAHRFYQRLGYQQLQAAPYQNHWEFMDSDGNFHQGNELLVDMMKTLNS